SERAGGGVGDVVGDEDDLLRVEPGQGRGEELRRPLGVGQAQVVPRVVQAHLVGGPGEAEVEGVGDGVEVLRLEPGVPQAPAHGQLGQLPGGERDGTFAVLAAAEPLLLRGGDDRTVDDERGRRVVEQGVDAEYAHGPSRVVQVTYR